MTPAPRRWLPAAATALALGAALACAGLLPRAPAEVSVEVLSGFARAPALAPGAAPLVLVLDVTPSMAEGPAAGPVPLESARLSAGWLLDAAPPGTPVSLRVLGIVSGGECGPAIPVDGPRSSADLAALAPVLEPRSEGSLAGALQAVARELAAAPAEAPDVRVVVLSDGGGQCGGDLCAAVDATLAAGAQLDFVDLGPGTLPDCLQNPTFGEGPGRLDVTPAVAEAPAFSIEPAGPTKQGGGPRVTAAADGTRVSVAPGPVRIAVALDPPLVVGPLELASGAQLRLRVLEFPAHQPPRREVFLVRDGAEAVPLPDGPGAATAGSAD